MPGRRARGSLLAERLLHNDLEAAARSLCPPIGDALASVRAAGAVRAMVSGSGPTVVGLFPGDGRARARRGPPPRRCASAIPARSPPTPVGRAYAEPRRPEPMHPAWLAGRASRSRSTSSSAAAITAA